MSICENAFVLDLRQPQGHACTRGEQLREQLEDVSISELLESLGADCLEIRFRT